jgi:hypothetical protein
MVKTLGLLSAVALLCSGTGCATVYPKVSVKTFGDVDLRKDQNLSELAQRAEIVPEIRVLQGALPEGISIEEDNSKIIVQPGFESRYTILGTVESDYTKEVFTKSGESSGGLLRSYLLTSTYDETWRKVLCYPQAPFKLLTLGVWNLFVPLAWPCFRKGVGADELVAVHIEYLKKGAKALGANTVIITHSGTLTTVSGNQYGVSTSIAPNASLTGFAFIDRGAEARAPNEATPPEAITNL